MRVKLGARVFLAGMEHASTLFRDHLKHTSSHFRLVMGDHVTGAHNPVVRKVFVLLHERPSKWIFAWVKLKRIRKYKESRMCKRKQSQA